MTPPNPSPDPRNDSIFVHVGGEILPRAQAKVSVFDSSVQGGDAVWEGLRVYQGRVFALDRHLDRLLASAHSMAFTPIPPRDAIKTALFACLKKNGMRDGVHVRLTLTRGVKVTSGMDPRNNRSGPCLIVLPEWKLPGDTSGGGGMGGARGIRLITAAIRRNPPQCVDSKIHHNNLINNILAKIEANVAGVDDALMLDLNGFVSETNATNVFLVRGGRLMTPHADACLPGITRAIVMEIADSNGVAVVEKNLSLSEVWSADEMFVTGTMGELTSVVECDGWRIGAGVCGPLTARLQELFAAKTAREGEPIPA